MFLPLIAALALQAVPAPQPAPVCTPGAPLPAEWTAWGDAHPLAHGFVIGRAVDLPTAQTATVRLAVQPSRPLSGTYLAVAGFEVKTAGRYQVAVGGSSAKIKPLWLDVAGADGQPLKSAGHGHGPDCSSITKVVAFDLKPGKYTFLATGLTAADPVRVLIRPAGPTSSN